MERNANGQWRQKISPDWASRERAPRGRGAVVGARAAYTEKAVHRISGGAAQPRPSLGFKGPEASGFLFNLSWLEWGFGHLPI